MFTQEQLDAIRIVARQKKNQGEISVYIRLDEYNGEYRFSEQQLNIIKFCAEECKRQRSGEMSVYDMVNAWNWAIVPFESFGNGYKELPIKIEFIEHIGKLVEPIDNKKGFRNWPVFVGPWEKEKPEFIEKDLMTLLYLYYEGVLTEYPNLNFGSPNHWLWDMAEKQELSDVDRFYYYYETIHPFIDGNGRSGKILYNYLLGSLDSPVLPPNFWNSSNP